LAKRKYNDMSLRGTTATKQSLNFKEKPLKRKRIYKGIAVDFWVDTIRLPNGAHATREYLGHPGAVAVVPILKAHKTNPQILLVKQYRYPVGEVTYELPAGKLGAGERPLPCVKRELEEETGYKAGQIMKILSFWPTAAFANEIIHIFKATKLSKGKFNPDDDEFIQPLTVSLKDAIRKIRSGKIKDAKTIIGLLSIK